MKQSIAFILIILATLTASAQDRSKWTNEMLEAKHKMLIEEVGLTPNQQEQFMPLYEAMEREIYTTNRVTRQDAGGRDRGQVL